MSRAQAIHAALLLLALFGIAGCGAGAATTQHAARARDRRAAAARRAGTRADRGSPARAPRSATRRGRPGRGHAHRRRRRRHAASKPWRATRSPTPTGTPPPSPHTCGSSPRSPSGRHGSPRCRPPPRSRRTPSWLRSGCETPAPCSLSPPGKAPQPESGSSLRGSRPAGTGATPGCPSHCMPRLRRPGA